MALLTKRERNRYPVTRDPVSGMLSLQDEMNRLYEDFFSGLESPFRAATRPAAVREFMPSVDVSDTDGQVKVSAELPGMTEKDINVEIEGDMITISGEKKEEEEKEEKGGRYWKESSYGCFRRDIPLPTGVDTEKAKASFKNGKLRVTIPKAEDAKDKRKSLAISSE
jgi:HSP20 family protein